MSIKSFLLCIKITFFVAFIVLLTTNMAVSQDNYSIKIESLVIDNFLISTGSTHTWDKEGNLFVIGKNLEKELYLKKYAAKFGNLVGEIKVGDSEYNGRKLLVTKNDNLMVLCIKERENQSNLCLYKYDLSLNCLSKFESDLKSPQQLDPKTMLEDGNDDIIVLCYAKGLEQDPSKWFVGVMKFCCDNTNPMATKFNTMGEQPSSNGYSSDDAIMINYNNSYSYAFNYTSEGKFFKVKTVDMSFEKASITKRFDFGVNEFLILQKTKYKSPYVVFNDHLNQGSLLALDGSSYEKRLSFNETSIIAALTDDSGYVYTLNWLNSETNCKLRKDSVNYPISLAPKWGQFGVDTEFNPTMLACSDNGLLAVGDEKGNIKLYDAYSEKGNLIESRIDWDTGFKLDKLVGNKHGIYAIGISDSPKSTLIKRITIRQ